MKPPRPKNRNKERGKPNTDIHETTTGGEENSAEEVRHWWIYTGVTALLSMVVAVFLFSTYRIFSNFPRIYENGVFSAADSLSAASDTIATVLGVAVALAGSWVAINLAEQANKQSKNSVELEQEIKRQNDLSTFEKNFQGMCETLEITHDAQKSVDISCRALLSAVRSQNPEKISAAKLDLSLRLDVLASQLRRVYTHPVLGAAWKASSRRCKWACWAISSGNSPLSGEEKRHQTSEPLELGLGVTIDPKLAVEGLSEELITRFHNSESVKKEVIKILERRTSRDPVAAETKEKEIAPHIQEIRQISSGSALVFGALHSQLVDVRCTPKERGRKCLTEWKLMLDLIDSGQEDFSLSNFENHPAQTYHHSDKGDNEGDNQKQDLAFIWRGLNAPFTCIDAFSSWAKFLREKDGGDILLTHAETAQYIKRRTHYREGLKKTKDSDLSVLIENRTLEHLAAYSSGSSTIPCERFSQNGKTEVMLIDYGSLVITATALGLPVIDDITRASSNTAGFDVHTDSNKAEALAYYLERLFSEVKFGISNSPHLLLRKSVRDDTESDK